MEKYIYNEQNGLWYELQGDYYLPCLKLPEEGEVHIGIWGQRHLRYLKQYHRVRYYNLLTSGKLNDYLVDVETWAQQMFDELVNALSRNENLTEDFKATNPVEWVINKLTPKQHFLAQPFSHKTFSGFQRKSSNHL